MLCRSQSLQNSLQGASKLINHFQGGVGDVGVINVVGFL